MATQDANAASRPFVTYLLLWLAGASLRITLLAVPPVIPLLHSELRLSESAVGALSGLPPFLFALAAVPGSLFIARLGALPTLAAGLVLTGVGSALRGASGDTLILFLTTMVMGLGVAIMQPAMPPIVRDWTPRRIGFATAIYSNGLLVGEVFSAGLTIPLVLPLLGNSWRLSLVFWSLPVLATALLVFAWAPRTGHHARLARAGARWWPDWRSGRTWRLGFLMGGINSIYFATNGFLPDFLHATGRPELVNAALTAINLGQLPASFLLLGFADRIAGRAAPLVTTGVLCLLGLSALIVAPGGWVVAAAAVLGFAVALGLILTLALPAIVSEPQDVHRTSAGMFTISYCCPVIVSLIGGWLWDVTARPPLAFVPELLCTLLVIALAPLLGLGHRAPRR